MDESESIISQFEDIKKDKHNKLKNFDKDLDLETKSLNLETDFEELDWFIYA